LACRWGSWAKQQIIGRSDKLSGDESNKYTILKKERVKRFGALKAESVF
jgi:hypothetical protein